MANAHTVRTWQNLRRTLPAATWTGIAEANPCTPDEMDPKPKAKPARLTQAQQMDRFYADWAHRQAESKGQ